MTASSSNFKFRDIADDAKIVAFAAMEVYADYHAAITDGITAEREARIKRKTAFVERESRRLRQHVQTQIEIDTEVV